MTGAEEKETTQIPKDPIPYTIAHFYNKYKVFPIATFLLGAGLTGIGLDKVVTEFNRDSNAKEKKAQIALAKKAADKNNGMVTFCDVSNVTESTKNEYILQEEECHTVTYAQAVQEITERKNREPSPTDKIMGWGIFGLICLVGGMLSKFGMDKAANKVEAHYADEVTRNRAIAFSLNG